MSTSDGHRFVNLDGWRGISILLVLASHLLPLGPDAWELNLAAGLLGMACFFTLSGFLVTHFLLEHASTLDFLLRRIFRIVPLAWLFMALSLAVSQVPGEVWRAHFFFYANLPPKPLTPLTEHLWSLCVEMHFYLGVALLHLLFRERGLRLLPLICILITLGRIAASAHFSPVTWFRIDEILVGAVLALIYQQPAEAWGRRSLAQLHPLMILPFLLLSCHPAGGWITYLRPYFAALLIGTTLFQAHTPLAPLLRHHVLVYIASISYALYVLHPALALSWLGEGETLEKYLKRPLLFIALFALAHLSTHYFEQPCIRFGKWLSARLRAALRGPLLEK